MVNVAIVGFGLSGRYLQAPFFEANENYFLKTILSNNQNPAEFFPQVNVVKNIEEILDDPTIDLVSICSPNNTHYQYAKLVLQAGKHVLVEKPFTAFSNEASELIALAKSKNKIISIFQNRRFDSDFLTVQKLIKSGELGEMLNFEIHYNRYKPELNPKKWKETNSEGSGIIYDLGAHIIDQAIALFGIPQNVWGQSFTQRKNSVIQDAFDIMLNYGTLKVTLRSSLLVREPSPRYIIHGTNGSFIKYGIDVQEDHLKAGMQPNDKGFGIEPLEQHGKKYYNNLNEIIVENVLTEKGNWALLFQNLYEAIVVGTPLLIKPEEVVEQLKIIEAVVKK
jgi:scyllo-inositol 2-dehydrogenase (NADP+)